MLPIASPALLSDQVEVLIKESRSQANFMREDAEREVIAAAVVAARPFEDADKSLLTAGGSRSIG